MAACWLDNKNSADVRLVVNARSMQSFETATRGWLSEHDLAALNQQLAPIFREAIQSMIVEGIHRQAPHLRLRWLGERFQTESESMENGHVSSAPAGKSTGKLPQPCGNLAPPAPAAAAASHAPPASDYATKIELSEQRRDDSHMKAVFERHKDLDGGLSKAALMRALTQVDAPVLSSSDGVSEDGMFRRADSNASGFVDFEEFKTAANLPDELEMFLCDHDLGRVTPALRVHAHGESNQLDALRSVTAEQMRAAVAASASSMERQLHRVQQLLQQITSAQEKLQAQLDEEPGKYVAPLTNCIFVTCWAGTRSARWRSARWKTFTKGLLTELARQIWTMKSPCWQSTAAWADAITSSRRATTRSPHGRNRNGFILLATSTASACLAPHETWATVGALCPLKTCC